MYRGENNGVFWSKTYMLVRKILVYTILAILTFLCLFTLYVLIVNSTRAHDDIRTGFSALPSVHFGTNFYKVFFSVDGKTSFISRYNTNFLRAMGNSAFVAICATACSVYFSTVIAYGIHMYRFKLRNAAFTFILVVMMIPTQVSTTGFISMCYKLKWIDHFFPLILPSIAAPVTFFYIKQYMESVLPFEMVEAARVDGAGELRIFHQIVLPVMKPALAVQIIFAFVASWNNYFLPQLVLVADSNKKTLPIVIATLYSASNGALDFGLIYMAIFLAIVPLAVVYFIFSRYIMKGLTLGAVKG
jgi:multiple sugar transport system permease protein